MADEEPKKASGTCVHCQNATYRVCGPCRKAPLYDECSIEPTFYCSRTCEDADWPEHKGKCNKLRARKYLGRAAILLQDIFYLIRLYASTLRFKSLRLEGSTIFLDGFVSGAGSHSRESEQALKPFPVPIDGDQSLAKAAVVYMGSLEALMYLHGFAKEIMAEVAHIIEESTVCVIDRKLQICPISPNGQQMVLADSLGHNLYRITLKNQEVWAVDTTGAPFGYPDPLCPWHDLGERRSCKVLAVGRSGKMRRQAYLAEEIPMRHFVADIAEKRDLAEALDEKIPALAQEWQGKLSTIVKGSEAAFESAKGRFLDHFEEHLRVSITKLYAPDQIAKRNERVDDQLALNVANPNSREAWDEATSALASMFEGRMAVSRKKSISQKKADGGDPL